MPRWLHLRLTGPLMSFGGVAIDQVGPTRDLPAASALTGLLANALDWHWREADRHQSLQNRLIFGALVLRQGRLLTDVQNARVYEAEPAWTTFGDPQKRNKGPSYSNKPLPEQTGTQEGRKWMTHQRSRDYIADGEVRVVLRLDPPGAEPTLDDLAQALDRPARPLFLGRKPCLPSAPLNTGWIEADTARAALQSLAAKVESGGGAAIWSGGDAPGDSAQVQDLPDIRNWRSGVHTGTRRVLRGTLP